MELISIWVSKSMVKPFILSTWYRPLGSTIDVMDRFEAEVIYEMFHILNCGLKIK